MSVNAPERPFQGRQVWDARIRAYRLVRVSEVELERLRFIREENQRRQQRYFARAPGAIRVS